MPVESARLGVVVRGAGWQIAHCYGKPLEQPLSQRPHHQVQRQPVQNLFLYRHRLQHCHDALFVGGSPTLKTHPQEPPSRVGRKLNGKGVVSPRHPGAESLTRFGAVQPATAVTTYAAAGTSAAGAEAPAGSGGCAAMTARKAGTPPLLFRTPVTVNAISDMSVTWWGLSSQTSTA